MLKDLLQKQSRLKIISINACFLVVCAIIVKEVVAALLLLGVFLRSSFVDSAKHEQSVVS